MSEETKIYIADLAAYNSGYLHGIWIVATDDLDDIWMQIRAMLKKQALYLRPKKYTIHDYEGFGGYSVSEYERIDNLHEIACFLEDCPDFGGELLNHCGDLEEAKKMAEES